MRKANEILQERLLKFMGEVPTNGREDADIYVTHQPSINDNPEICDLFSEK